MRSEQLTAQALKATNNNRYLLSVAVAKRVREITNGEAPLVDVKDPAKAEPTDIALEEIAKGLVKVNLEQ